MGYAINSFLKENITNRITKEMKTYKSPNIYFKSHWNNFEIVCFVTVLISNFIELLKSQIFANSSSDGFILDSYLRLIMITVFLVNINMLKYLRVSEKFSGLFRLIGNVMNDIKYFITIFVLFVINFIWFFYIY